MAEAEHAASEALWREQLAERQAEAGRGRGAREVAAERQRAVAAEGVAAAAEARAVAAERAIQVS